MKKNLSIALIFLAAASSLISQDSPLSAVLIEGQGWEKVSEGHQFADGGCGDAEGNFYFSDVAKGSNIFKVSLDGKVTPYLTNAPKVSGLKFGPDGKLYACQFGLRRVVSFDKEGKIEVIADNVDVNDLVVTRKGDIYFTGGKNVHRIGSNRQVQVVESGIASPNGITVSPDSSTLVVTDYAGTNLWTFKIEADGRLSSKQPYMTVEKPSDKKESAADGMSVDADGRYYVTTHLGIQMFDATGRLGGIIAKPENKFTANCGFGGEYLYVVSSDKVFRRKTKVRQAWLFTK